MVNTLCKNVRMHNAEHKEYNTNLCLTGPEFLKHFTWLSTVRFKSQKLNLGVCLKVYNHHKKVLF